MSQQNAPAEGDGAPRRRHRRDPEGNRDLILRAAQAAFAECGYTRATVRDIAQRAGVTHGLVMRQFGSKEQLFLAAVPGTRDVGLVVDGDPQTLPERVAAAYVDRLEHDSAGDPVVAVLRSAASNERAAVDLYSAMLDRTAAAYKQVVTGDDADVRVDLLAAVLIGVTFSRYIIGVGPVAQMSPQHLQEHLARLVRSALFG
ncbi:TetR family transcriptional regulator [Catellatospora sp. NPDC049111]|jgi:AcrR family transcriptional regulator|uniref:TetR/AcrR family transcriptional regulator n=1 Tax=unclassified Catellatospora TaxID=2645785 RepID=UPI0033EA3E04